jgi:hypothetical protein
MIIEGLETAQDTDVTVGLRKRLVDPVRAWKMEAVFRNSFADVRKKAFGFTAEKFLDLGK